MSRRPRGEVRRALPALQRKLDEDLLAFTRACNDLAATELAGGSGGGVASPAMTNTLALWRADVDEAIDRLNRTSPKARGRALALETMNTLALALVQLSDGLRLADADAARASADQSLTTLATYQQLAGDLAEAVDERHRAPLARPPRRRAARRAAGTHVRIAEAAGVAPHRAAGDGRRGRARGDGALPGTSAGGARRCVLRLRRLPPQGGRRALPALLRGTDAGLPALRQRHHARHQRPAEREDQGAEGAAEQHHPAGAGRAAQGRRRPHGLRLSYAHNRSAVEPDCRTTNPPAGGGGAGGGGGGASGSSGGCPEGTTLCAKTGEITYCCYGSDACCSCQGGIVCCIYPDCRCCS